MDSFELIIECLGLQDVIIEKYRTDRQARVLELWVRQRREGARCYQCLKPLYGTHGWRQRLIKGAPMGAYNSVRIYYFRLQAACDYCQRVRLAHAPYLHPRFKNMTCSFAETAGRLMEEITCEAVGRLLNHNSKHLWSLDQWRIELMRQNFKLPPELDVSLLSADEVHMRTIRPKKQRLDKSLWEKKFITNLVCYKHAKVIASSAGRSAASLKQCLMELSEPQRLSVEYLAVDMYDPFLRTAAKHCPNAKIAVDRFHLAEQLNKRFDEVRKTELAKAKEQADKFQETMLSGSNRFILVERERDLSKHDLSQLQRLRDLNQNIHTGMLLVEYFHKLLDKTDVKSFRKSLERWYVAVKESKLKPFQKFARLVRKYRLNIETYIRSHLTTAVSEGLNTKIKTLKRMGYGYTNQDAFMNKILQRCGFINSHNIDTTDWFWSIQLALAPNPTN